MKFNVLVKRISIRRLVRWVRSIQRMFVIVAVILRIHSGSPMSHAVLAWFVPFRHAIGIPTQPPERAAENQLFQRSNRGGRQRSKGFRGKILRPVGK